MARSLKEQSEIWHHSTGEAIQLCVVEELDTEGEFTAEAVITFGGFSLCREHFDKVTNLIKDGTPMGRIVEMMMTTGLDYKEENLDG